jgi:hypothetical protein
MPNGGSDATPWEPPPLGHSCPIRSVSKSRWSTRAVGGTALLPIHAGNWTATGAHSLYHAAIDAVADSGAPIDAIVWIQGEDDANAGVTANAYSDGLADLIARLRADLGDVPVLIQRLLIPLPGMDAINQGQTDYAAGDAAAFIYGTMPPTETLIPSEADNLRPA